MTFHPKPVVLVVEDEGVIRMLAGAQARIEVLFTDINMPGPLDGIDLAEHLQALAPRLHVIITSALPVVRPIDHLAATFVAKPYDLQAVCRTARDLLAA